MYKKNIKIGLIVIILLLVFLNPLVVNSFHTLEDHIHHHHCCQNNSAQIIIDIPDEYCPIHEYEFSINDIPESDSKEYSDTYFTEIPLAEVTELALEILNNQSSPRAPPPSPDSIRG